MRSRLRSGFISVLAVIVLIVISLFLGVNSSTSRVLAAQPQESGPRTPKKSSVRIAIERTLDQSTPPAVTNLLKTVGQDVKGGGVRYNDFMRRAIAEAIETGTTQGAVKVNTPLPKFDARIPGGFAAFDQLTDDHVRKILAGKLQSLTHAVAPKPQDLKALIKTHNASAKARPRARSVRASLGSTASNQPLPTQPRLDWRDAGLVVQESGIVTAVKDQGQCGCCWAFATIAAVEAAFARDNFLLIDASEQYVLNNSQFLANANQAYTCDGGLWAFDLLLAGTTPGGLAPGVPNESDVQYAGEYQGPVNQGVALPYQLQAWGYVDTNDPNAIPTDDELKTALCEKGPLAITVYVPTGDNDSASFAWMGNHGEPLSDFPNDPSKGITHAVLLVGWDDTVVSLDGANRGAWIIKNSWGPWGIPLKNSDTGSGFGYVSYGFNNIGYAASWVSPVPAR